MKFMRMKFTIETILNECCKLMNENVMFIKSFLLDSWIGVVIGTDFLSC